MNKLVLEPGFAALHTWLTLAVLEPYVPKHIFAEAIRDLPLAVKFLAAIFLLDLAQYLRHRLMHAWLWGFHATHHSAVELRASVHWRLHPVDLAFLMVFDTAFLFVLGFPGGVIFLSQIFRALHNMWLHANLDVDYGPLRKVFVSPNYHKWHHAKEKEAIDKNFADIFVFLDILGGTHYYPHDRRVEEFGCHGIANDAPLHQDYLGAMLYPLARLKEPVQK